MMKIQSELARFYSKETFTIFLFIAVTAVLLLLSSCSFNFFLDLEKTAYSGFAEAEIIYIHGAGDDSGTWATELLTGENDFALDWSVDASDRMAAPAKGYQLGQELSKYLYDIPRTIYAHSAGAWVAQGIADGIAERGDFISITIIFLDPFSALSVFQPFAGSRMLGLNATNVKTFYTTRDHIPFTNGSVAVGSCVNLNDLLPLDVTGTDAHWAVIDWYMDNR